MRGACPSPPSGRGGPLPAGRLARPAALARTRAGLTAGTAHIDHRTVPQAVRGSGEPVTRPPSPANTPLPARTTRPGPGVRSALAHGAGGLGRRRPPRTTAAGHLARAWGCHGRLPGGGLSGSSAHAGGPARARAHADAPLGDLDASGGRGDPVLRHPSPDPVTRETRPRDRHPGNPAPMWRPNPLSAHARYKTAASGLSKSVGAITMRPNFYVS